MDVEKILKLQEQGMGKSKIASMIYGTKGAYKKKLDNFMQSNGYISIDGKYVKENVDGIHLEYVKCNNGIQTDIKETPEEKTQQKHGEILENTHGIQMESTENVEVEKNKEDHEMHLEYTEHDESNKENMPIEYKNNTKIIHQKEALEPVNKLSLEYRKRIDKMLEWFENKNNIEGEVAVTVTDVIEIGLKIDDKIKDGEFTKMSSYINKEIWNEFKDFMKEYKEVGNKYILSQAVKEYMDKYKKTNIHTR